MISHAVDTAVILAAGARSLQRVGGLSLIKRAILSAAREAAVERFVIVVEGDGGLRSLAQDPDLAGLHLAVVGPEVLTRWPTPWGEVLLLWAEHVLDPTILQRLQASPARGGAVLAVGTPDGDQGSIAAVRSAPRLLEVLRHARDVSAAQAALAGAGPVEVVDVSDRWWHAVTDLQSAHRAEARLFRALTKPTDGVISRRLNRHISMAITRAVMDLPITPNHMTAVALLVGLAAVALTAATTAGSLWLLGLGGVLFQLSSIIDGCDGEIARLKYQHSDWGRWFDTISDDIVKMSWFPAAGYALSHITGQGLWLALGVFTFGVGWLLTGSIYRDLLSCGEGSHLVVEWAGGQHLVQKPTAWQRFLAWVEPIAHRDLYMFIIMCLSLAGADAIKIAVALGAVQVVITAVQWLDIQSRRRALAEAHDAPRPTR